MPSWFIPLTFQVPFRPTVAVDGNACVGALFWQVFSWALLPHRPFLHPTPSFTPRWVVDPSGVELPAFWHMPPQGTYCPHLGAVCFWSVFSAKHWCWVLWRSPFNHSMTDYPNCCHGWPAVSCEITPTLHVDCNKLMCHFGKENIKKVKFQVAVRGEKRLLHCII